MKNTWRALAASCALVSGIAAAALSAGDQYKMDQILNGGPVSIRSAAQSIAGGGASPAVLDVLAETALAHMNDDTRAGVDAVAWSCKALAAAGGKRYYTIVKTITDNPGTHRNARKHCDRAAGDLGGADEAQYVAGTVSLDKARASAGASAAVSAGGNNALTAAAAKASAAPAAAANGQYKPITEVKVGMSQQEAFAIAGPPTATTSHVTGKAFIPFNFKGGDSYRSYGLYKGQGRIVFSNNSHYSSGQSVVEVLINPNESGYP